MNPDVAPADFGVEHVVVISSASRRLRRNLGVVAWAVLDDISLGRWDDHSLVASTNERRIAEHLVWASAGTPLPVRCSA